MDKAIKKHFGKIVKTPQEKKLLGHMLKDDKKLDASIKCRTCGKKMVGGKCSGCGKSAAKCTCK